MLIMVSWVWNSSDPIYWLGDYMSLGIPDSLLLMNL